MKAIALCLGLGVALTLGTGARPSQAYQTPDGRLEVNGFVETQVRGLSEGFREELDLAQWYNVLNLEFEYRLSDDGWGPIGFVSAFARVEGRYDAIYSRGFGLFPSAQTYGDRSSNLPHRLRDARNRDFGGVQAGTEGAPRRHPDRDPVPLAPPGEDRGIPDFDDFFRQAGGDGRIGTDDDPARYASEAALGHRFALVGVRGGGGQRTRVLGPWLPKNELRALALGDDRANPFRGRIAASAIPSGWDPLAGTGGVYADPFAVRFFAGDPQLAGFTPGEIAALQIDPLAPGTPLTEAILAPPTVITEVSLGKCERAGVALAACTPGTSFQDPDVPFPRTFTVRALREFARLPLAGAGDFASAGLDANGDVIAAYGGDFSGVIPCLDPTADLAARQRGEVDPTLQEENPGCIPGSFSTLQAGGQTLLGERRTDPANIRYTGGQGENPFRPGPDRASADPRARRAEARGLYVPSVGLRRALGSGDLDSLDFEYGELDRAFNRGASQQRTRELKEAYLDVDAFDSRLWMRLGLQNIVWSKTEIFRNTDQWNPQDQALSSLPTLEESRIALWSARWVYSLWDVGPLEDVRLELALSLDQFVPDDLGACGEPYTADAVCGLTYGIFSHSFLGAGIAGVDRPESLWEGPEDVEIGGRIEWRWDRFSFALTEFYGHSDAPYPDAIFYYGRSVDVMSGRPVVATLPGQALGRCALGGQIVPDPVHKAGPGDPGLAYSTSFASHPYSVTPAQTPIATTATGPDRLPDGSPLDGSTAVRGGIGRDPDCLRPGGAPGFANAFALDSEAVIAATNALQFHAANQQLFAWTCLATVGIAAALEPGACAWTVFASSQNFRVANIPVAEAFSVIFAGDPDGPTAARYLSLINDFQKNAALSGALVASPLSSINRLFNDPRAPFDRNGNGQVDAGAGCADDDPGTPCDLGGYDGFDTRTERARFPGQPTLDSSLTNEQRALLGCGPFYGTRCDSSSRETQTADFPQSGAFGGIDFLNLEASALLQAWLGVEGTLPGQLTTDNRPQPGTVGPLGVPVALGGGVIERRNLGFEGGPACTRFAGRGQLLKLPGCRGVESLTVVYSDPNGVPGDADDVPTQVQVQFESGYLPSVDGCVLGDVIRRRGGQASVPVQVVGATAQLQRELERCSGATVRRAVPRDFISGFDANGNPNQVPNTGQNPDIAACDPTQGRSGARIRVNGRDQFVFVCASEEVTLAELPLIHPLAGCIDSPVNPGGGPECFQWANRDLVEEFFAGTAQLFQNELAAVSWNFLMFLAISSCDLSSPDLDGQTHEDDLGRPTFAGDSECFLPSEPYRAGRCSLSNPNLCRNVKSFFAAAGVGRNTVRAAGNPRFGRRTFIWHSGGEAVLRYDRRNVLGFATDFAEDWSKTSWALELTWMEDELFLDNDDPRGVSESDSFTLTVSVDRPTFVRFLNPNRSFFVNTQWFITWLPEHGSGYAVNGPLNAIFTLTLASGYYQDRLTPQLVTVYDIGARSGGVLPSVRYQFDEHFSAELGVYWFFGRTQLRPMPLRELSPVVNRAGPGAYRDGVDNGLAGIRRRDEVFLKLRWAF